MSSKLFVRQKQEKQFKDEAFMNKVQSAISFLPLSDRAKTKPPVVKKPFQFTGRGSPFANSARV